MTKLIPPNSINPKSRNGVDKIFDRHQDSPLLRTYRYVQDQEAINEGGQVMGAIVTQVVWSPKNGAPRGVYGCVVELDDDLLSTVEKVPVGTKSRSNAINKLQFRVQGSCDRKPMIGQRIEVVIIPDDTSIIGQFHKLTNEFVSASTVESNEIAGRTGSKAAHQNGNGNSGTGNP